jgi:hypothetical protein
MAKESAGRNAAASLPKPRSSVAQISLAQLVGPTQFSHTGACDHKHHRRHLVDDGAFVRASHEPDLTPWESVHPQVVIRSACHAISTQHTLELLGFAGSNRQRFFDLVDQQREE